MSDSAARPLRRPRLHVVGCHRSGTTLMMELLWHGFELGGRAEHEASLFEPVPEGAGVYLTKKPPDTIRIGPAFEADDALFVIAMMRDPRSVITSRHSSRPEVYFSSFRRWRSYADAIGRYQSHPRYLVVRFEDLVRDPDHEQARIAGRFPFLRCRAPFSSFPEGSRVPQPAAESLNGVRPFDTTRVDAWRAHLPRVKGQLQRHPDLPAALRTWGYEADDSWLAGLDGVTAYQQRYKEAEPHWFKRLETAWRFRRKLRRYLRARGIRA